MLNLDYDLNPIYQFGEVVVIATGERGRAVGKNRNDGIWVNFGKYVDLIIADDLAVVDNAITHPAYIYGR
jgi:hypothetical protein